MPDRATLLKTIAGDLFPPGSSFTFDRSEYVFVTPGNDGTALKASPGICVIFKDELFQRVRGDSAPELRASIRELIGHRMGQYAPGGSGNSTPFLIALHPDLL